MGVQAECIVEPSALSRRLSAGFDVSFGFESVDDAPFEARMRSFSLGRTVKLAQLAFSPHVTRRVSRSRNLPSHYFVNQLVEGESVIWQDGREATIRAGDIYIINPERDFRIETGSVLSNSLYVDAHAFRGAFPEVDCLTAVPLRQECRAAAMAGDMIRSLFRDGETFSESAQRKSGEAFPHILAIALAERAREEPPCPSKLVLFHKERIKSFVREHLHDPRLSCEMIADALRLSQRYVYDVFSDEEQTLMRWIKTERLHRCRRELESPTLRNRSIGEIAYSWGFVDLAHFSRVFRAEFGASPRSYRGLPRPH